MIYRVKNRRQGPISLALHSQDGKGTQTIVLPWKQTFDIPEERFSEQIRELERRGDVAVEEIRKN